MNKLEAFVEASKVRREAQVEATRQAGKTKLGPTANGGFYLNYDDKDIRQDMTLQDLREMRDCINDFLHNVCGEKDVL